MHRATLLHLSASCPDQVGIIARVSGFIAQHQRLDPRVELSRRQRLARMTSRYFMRIEIKADSLPFHLAEFRERFRPLADEAAVRWTGRSAIRR
jgi:formyltetrahydrofolate deformylase